MQEQADLVIHWHRANIARLCISEPHWDIIKEEKEAVASDKEAYEYEIENNIRRGDVGLSAQVIGAPESAMHRAEDEDWRLVPSDQPSTRLATTRFP